MGLGRTEGTRHATDVAARELSLFPVRTSVVRTLRQVEGVSRLAVVAGGEIGVIPTLDKLAQTVIPLIQRESGPHMALVSTLALKDDPKIYEDRAMMLARKMGTILPADAEGTQLIRVYDKGDMRALADGGLYRHSRTPGKPHTDNICLPEDIDCLMLLCARPAAKGGESVLVSAERVRETLLRENAQAADILAQRIWPFSTKGMGEERLFYKPVLSEDGKAHYMGDYLKRAEELSGTPLTGEQEAALQALEEVLERPELKIVIPLRSGDILMTEDSRWFHSREPWEDNPSLPLGNARCMGRIWVKFDPVG